MFVEETTGREHGHFSFSSSASETPPVLGESNRPGKPVPATAPPSKIEFEQDNHFQYPEEVSAVPQTELRQNKRFRDPVEAAAVPPAVNLEEILRLQHPRDKDDGDSEPAGSHQTVATTPPGGGGRGSHHRTISGRSGVDYPTHNHVPLTTFYCYNQQHPGYYADPEAGCQVFHVCNVDGRQDSFLCPPGTVFNQPYFVCDWWFNVDCLQAPKYYALNKDMHKTVQRRVMRTGP